MGTDVGHETRGLGGGRRLGEDIVQQEQRATLSVIGVLRRTTGTEDHARTLLVLRQSHPVVFDRHVVVAEPILAGAAGVRGVDLVRVQPQGLGVVRDRLVQLQRCGLERAYIAGALEDQSSQEIIIGVFIVQIQ